MRFLSNVLATIVGLFLFFMIFFFGILIIGAVFGGSSETTAVKSNSVLVFDTENISQDYAGKFKDPLVTLFSESKNIGVSDILNAIIAAKDDDNIKGISILNNSSVIGMAQAKAIRDQLEDFKKSGKFVVAYANMYNQKDYYLDSVADTIYLNPVGEMDFRGLSAEVLFFKDLQEKSGVKLEVVRHGKYKSAVEPFLANTMSDENRTQITELINSVWSSIATDISKSRKISVDQINAIANGLLARTPEMALAQKLVDKVGYEDEYHNGIRKALNVEKGEEYNQVELVDYASNVALTPANIMASQKIAIIYAQGNILSGEGDVSYIGEESMKRSLEEARTNDNIKAVVLRVDSPGGSALTSDLIWREIELTKKTKPVVVSMGNSAASGGYYIACNANKIYAEASTITGSIGVFGMLPNITELSQRIGINAEYVTTHEKSTGYTLFRPLDETNREVIQESIERVYTTFVNRVATGRKMTFEQVDEIAQGRVWTGEQAVKIGLVDEIGGIDEAIKHAASLAKVDDYRTQNFPEYDKTFGDMLGELPFASAKQNLIKNEIGEENYAILEQIKRLTAQTGLQALMPFEIIIK